MSYRSNEAYKSHKSDGGGYENLIVYSLAVDIYDLTTVFCNRFIDKKSRTNDQMIQAARSGKQNIVEGSLSRSTESNIKLTSVARASFGELLEDYRDFLRQRNLPVWFKDDSRVMEIRSYKTYKANETKRSNYKSYRFYESYLTNAESFANLMITLCYKTGYLLDRLIEAQQQKFIHEGGFRENLFKKRREHKSNKTYGTY